MSTDPKVARIWSGWTRPENADTCQAIAGTEVFPAIINRCIPGLISAQLMRADDVVDGEIEFTTVIWFDNLDSVRNLMGSDYRRAYLPEKVRAVLERYDREAKHFHLVGEFG